MTRPTGSTAARRMPVRRTMSRNEWRGVASPELPAGSAAVAYAITAAAIGTAGASATNQVTVGLTGDREIHWGGPDRAAEKAAVLLPLLGQSGHRYDVSSPELPTIRP